MARVKIGCVLFFVLVPVLLFVANSVWNAYEDASIGQKYNLAMEQCEKYGGQSGELPIITEGILDTKRAAGNNDALERAAIFINNGLLYVEFHQNIIALTGSSYPNEQPYFKNYSDKYKFYRVFVAKKGNPLCKPYEEKKYRYFDQEFLGEESCVAIVGFDDPGLLKSRYQLTVVDKIIDEGVEVEWNNLLVIERRSQTVVASYNTFSHCFTDYQKNASQGFSYCRGIYSNEKVRPKCPAEYAKDAGVINQFEKSAFSYERDI